MGSKPKAKTWPAKALEYPISLAIEDLEALQLQDSFQSVDPNPA